MNALPFVLFGWCFFCGAIFLLSWIFMLLRLSRLNNYMKKNHYHKWRELSSIGQFGPGLSNPFRGIKYVFSNYLEEDEKLLRLKDSAKISARYSFIFGATFVFSIVAVFLIMIIYKI